MHQNKRHASRDNDVRGLEHQKEMAYFKSSANNNHIMALYCLLSSYSEQQISFAVGNDVGSNISRRALPS